MVKEQVRAGLNSLHGIQLAHCDISINNVFIDMNGGTVFLDDLEYLTPIYDPPPHRTRLPHGIKPNAITTAIELDEAQFKNFCCDLTTLN